MIKTQNVSGNCTEQCPEVLELKLLTGCIVHDINNILMAIKGNITLMGDENFDEPEIRRRLKNIDDCVHNATELSSEILSFIRNEKAQKDTLDVNILIKKIIRVYRRIFRGVFFEPEYEKEIFPVHANRSQMERVVLNLFINAWKAMPKGGTIQIRTENIWFPENLKIMKSRHHSRYVKIIIVDTGTGMDADIRERLFEPFFSGRTDQTGMGIGMTSVQRIIEDHEGFIHLHSQENAGTRLEIYIPAVTE